MDVDNHVSNPKGAQPAQGDFQERMACDFDQGLGPIISERPQARAETGGQVHRLHLPRFSSSRCRTITSTPLLRRKYLANCSARYTERCCPPVQPKDTIRFLKPRD